MTCQIHDSLLYIENLNQAQYVEPPKPSVRRPHGDPSALERERGKEAFAQRLKRQDEQNKREFEKAKAAHAKKAKERREREDQEFEDKCAELLANQAGMGVAGARICQHAAPTSLFAIPGVPVMGGGWKKMRAWKKLRTPPPPPPGVACAKKAVAP